METKISDLSGLKRISLIGRDEILEEIYKRGENAECKKRSALIYLEGKGGIGKTAILERFHQDIHARGGALLVEDILDIYHLENQTVRGFCDALVVAFPEYKIVFSKYEKYVEEVDNAYFLSDYDQAANNWEKAEDALAKALSNLTRDSYGKDRPVWILIDTAEMLYLKVSHRGDMPQMGMERLSAWLPKFLPLLRGQPIVLVLAGRPPQDELPSFLEILSEDVKAGWLIGDVIHLTNLDDQACGEYLEKVAELLQNNEDMDGANKIRIYVKENSLNDLQRETKGEPLYLAMTCDILRTGGSLSDGFYGKRSDSEGGSHSYFNEPLYGFADPIRDNSPGDGIIA